MKKLAVACILLSCACGAPSKFAMREPVVRDSDDRPIAHAPKNDEESDYANSLDVVFLRPLSHAFLFQVAREAHDVNSLDEVPDSTWYTNRRPTVAEATRGACVDAPEPPFTVKSSKAGGTTPGLVVKDARGRKYLFKTDDLGPRAPEISTAADAIGSRFYWALGFNAPCNTVERVKAADFKIGSGSVHKLAWGEERPLEQRDIDRVLANATKSEGGTFRLSASRFIEGTPVGTWRTEGTRGDDPNDVIPHEDRRELRAERLLAAWIAHWDSRGPNTFDAFVTTSGPRGYVKHYFLDWSDALGGVPIRTPFPEPRMGFATVSNLPEIAADLVTIGLIRRPWDDVKLDARAPNLGYLDVAHFDALDFSPQTPMVRWARADANDLGWIARKIARFDVERVRAMVSAGALTNEAEREHLVEILMGRRDKILRAAFARSSPLGEPSLQAERFCLQDLAVTAGVASKDVTYALRASRFATLEPIAGARVCASMPPHVRSSTPGYVTLELVRDDRGERTRLRAHFYDLGARWFLAGVERE